MKKSARLFIILLSFVLCISMMPLTAFADDDIVLPEIPVNPTDAVDIALCEIAPIDDQVYSGELITPELTVTYGDKTLELNTDYTADYSNNLNPGTATVTITGSGKYTGTKTAEFTILKKTQTITGSSSYNKCYGNASFYLDAVSDGDGKLKYASDHTDVVTVSSAGRVYIKGMGKATITVYAAETDIFAQSENKTVTITVKPKRPTLSSVKNTGKNSATLTWTKVAKVTGYQIEYSVLSDFSKHIRKTVNGEDSLTAVVKKLTLNKKYYFRIRSFKTYDGTKYYSNWSAYKSAKIATGVKESIAAPKSIKFVDCDFLYNKISWSKVDEATGYEVYYKKGENGTWTKLKDVTGTTKKHKVSTGSYYYYRVRAYKEKADGSKVFSSYKPTATGMINYYDPAFSVTYSKKYGTTKAFAYGVTNTGNRKLIFYSKGAKVNNSGPTYYDCNLKLVKINDDGSAEYASSITVKPGETKTVAFVVDNDNKTTVYKEDSELYCRLKCDGMYYKVTFCVKKGTTYKLEEPS